MNNKYGFYSRSRYTIAVDLETSGDDPVRNGIVAISAVLLDENLNSISNFNSLVRPPDLSRFSWSIDAEAVHGINYETIERAPSNYDVMIAFLTWLAPFRERGKYFGFLCHVNPSGWFDVITKKWKIVKWFDWTFLVHAMRKEFAPNGRNFEWSFRSVFNEEYLESTVQMGRSAGYKKNDLATWSQRLGFSLDHHDAASDVKCCIEVYRFLKNQNLKI